MRFLFVDRIVELSDNEWIRGIKHITENETYLTLDTQGRPCFIPSLIGEALGQLAAWNVMRCNGFTARPVAGVVHSARLHRPAYVGETLLLESYIDVLDETAVQYHSEARVGDQLVFSIEGALGPLLPMAEFISFDEVQDQFSEIYSPGDWSVISKQVSGSTKASVHASDCSLNSMTFDKILSCEPGQSLVAEKRVPKTTAYFPDHFPRKPVLPMTVLLECKLNLARTFLALSGYGSSFEVSAFRKIKMSDFVLPEDHIMCHVKLKQQSNEELILSFRSEVNEKRVCVLDIVLKVMI